jgi:hypothetical protein
MNELERMCAEVRPPGGQVVEEGRQRLLAAAYGTRGTAGGAGRFRARRSARPPRRRVRLVALGALIVALFAGATIAQNVGGTDREGNPKPVIPGIPSGPVANAADVLNRAAAAAETDPSAPRPDQWIFTEDKQRFPAIGTRVITPKTPLVNFDSMTWRRVDGKQYAELQKKPMGDGKLRIVDGSGWKHNYATLAAMPTDPSRLADWVLAMDHRRVESAKERVPTLSMEYAALLRDGAAPPKAEAVIFRAIKLLPGVTLKKNAVDLEGRKAIAVGLVTNNYLQEEILLDRKTYRYLGERTIAIRDHTDRGLDGTRTVEKGGVLNLQVRTASSIVDKPGRTS